MSALVAGSVTYTVQGRSSSPRKDEAGFKHAVVKIAFGDSALTYPTGGVPLSGLSSWGYPYLVDSVVLADAAKGDGYVYKWDRTNNKLLMYRSAGFTPAGTVAAPTFTGNAIQPTFTVKNGTIGSNMSIGLTADAATASLVGGTGITADRALTTNNPVGTVTATGSNSAPAFTGTAVAAGVLVEVANTVAPSATVIYARVSGY